MADKLRSAITMTDEEIMQFLAHSRSATVATIGPGGVPHLVAMWYAIIDGEIWIQSKSKSQKIVNLRRDSRASVLLEAGRSYECLRGVSFEGQGLVSEKRDDLWRVAVSIFERYTGPYRDEFEPVIEGMIHKRTAVRIEVERVRSWDHRKLSMESVPMGGTTAPYISEIER
jgi:PPOX class probable F420-dependent enzyme